METSILRFILAHSRRDQILLVIFTVAGFPFLYLSLDLPKIIINKAIGGNTFPVDFLGFSFEQLPYLFLLSGIFLGLVLINGAFKYFINVYRGVVGERMLRRLRYQLYHNVLRFPLPQFRKLSQGEIVSMVTAETEPLGGYIGDAIALPAFQGGTLLIILIFMFVQDPLLGTAAVALYPLQTWLIPKLQRQVNLLKKERTREVRRLSEHIGESVTGIREIHANGASRFELAQYSNQVGKIFEIRYEIYRKKFFIKFVNNFIAQITPFFFYALGGYLVITGKLSFGALVAVLAAYKDLSSPWKELLNFYQLKEDARIKYDLLYDTFQPADLTNPNMSDADDDLETRLIGAMHLSNVDLSEADGSHVFQGQCSFSMDLPAKVALLGLQGGGKSLLAQVIGGIKKPISGSITVGGTDLLTASEALRGRRVAYVGSDNVMRTGTVFDNLVYGLLQRPVVSPQYSPEDNEKRTLQIREAVRAGNSGDDINADWVGFGPDSSLLQASGEDEVEAQETTDARNARLSACIEALTAADLHEDVFKLGLAAQLDPDDEPELAAQILEARSRFRERLEETDISRLIEPFDDAAYNTNMSVAENLVFGAPVSDEYKAERLHQNPVVLKLLDDFGLTGNFIDIGRKVAGLMVDLFADVEPGSDLFEQYSFISADDLPEFRTLLTRTAELQPDAIDAEDKAALIGLPFKLVVARHRLGFIDESFRARVLEARQMLAHRLAATPGAVEPFDRERFNPAVNIQDNILFGRLAYGRARGAAEIGAIITELVEQMGLRRSLIEAGLRYHIGVGGARLSTSQRQRLAIARAVLKQPDILVLDEATAALDESVQRRVRDNLFANAGRSALFWVVHRPTMADEFDYCVVIEDGRVVEFGEFAKLNSGDGPLAQMLAAS